MAGAGAEVRYGMAAQKASIIAARWLHQTAGEKLTSTERNQAYRILPTATVYRVAEFSVSLHYQAKNPIKSPKQLKFMETAQVSSRMMELGTQYTVHRAVERE